MTNFRNLYRMLSILCNNQSLYFCNLIPALTDKAQMLPFTLVVTQGDMAQRTEQFNVYPLV